MLMRGVVVGVQPVPFEGKVYCSVFVSEKFDKQPQKVSMSEDLRGEGLVLKFGTQVEMEVENVTFNNKTTVRATELKVLGPGVPAGGQKAA